MLTTLIEESIHEHLLSCEINMDYNILLSKQIFVKSNPLYSMGAVIQNLVTGSLLDDSNSTSLYSDAHAEAKRFKSLMNPIDVN